MKQRILSFVLAVCMIAVAIPVIALPAVAAGREGFTTSIELGGPNWPVAVTDDGENYYPQYNGGWSVGKYDYGKYYEFNNVKTEGTEPSYLTYNGSIWGTTNPFLYLKDGNGVLLGASRNEWEAANGPGAYYAETDSSGKATNGQAFVYTYTAPYGGTIDIGITSMVLSSLVGSAGVTEPPAPQEPDFYKAYFSIYINDVMVWPTAGGDVENPDDWAIYPMLDTDGKKITTVDDASLKNVKINVGDTIRFASARVDCALAKYTPVITYHDGYDIAPSVRTETLDPRDKTWPTSRGSNGVSELKQLDPYWIFGQFDTTANSFAPFLNQKREASEVWACTGNDPDILGNNGILINSVVKEFVGAFMVGNKETNLKPAYQYNAVATGSVEFGFAGDFFLVDENSLEARNASAKVAVYKNNVLVGNLVISTDASGVATVTSAKLTADVIKNDKIAFVVVEVTGGAIQVAAKPKVQYTAITSFIGAATTDKYVLAMDDASVIVGDKIALNFNAFGTRDVYQDADEVKLRVWDNTVVGEKTKDNAVAEIAMSLDILGTYAYTCVYDGLAPKQMTDSVTVQAFMIVDGEETIASAVQEISLADVAYEQYEEAVAARDDKQADLMVAMLNYGTAAQKYFGYNLDNLANKNLPAELQTIVKQPDGMYKAEIMDSKNPGASNYAYSEITAASLVFESTIGIRVYVDVAPSEADKPITIRHGLTENDLVGDGEAVDGAYAFTLSGISLKDLKTTQYFQVTAHYTQKIGALEINVPYPGNIFTYSVEAYVARMAYETDKPELSDLLHALMNLSDAVAAL